MKRYMLGASSEHPSAERLEELHRKGWELVSVVVARRALGGRAVEYLATFRRLERKDRPL